MSGINVSGDRRTVKIWPERPDVADVLEYAALLIKEFGWRTGGRPDIGGTVYDSCTTGTPPGGFSLHDATGAACERVSSLAGERARGFEGSTSKDGNYTKSTGDVGSWRTEANAVLFPVIQERVGDTMATDITFNDDPATTQADVIAVLDEARRRVQNA